MFLRHTWMCLQLSSKPQGRAIPLRVTLLHLYPKLPSSYLLWVCRNKFMFVRRSYISWYFWWDWVLMRILLVNQPLFFPNFLPSMTPQYFYSLPPRVGGLPGKGHKCAHLCGKIDSLFTWTRSEAFEYEREELTHRTKHTLQKNGLLILSHFGYGPKCKVQNKFAIIVLDLGPYIARPKQKA